MPHCRECGAEVPADSSICSSCGAVRSVPSAPQAVVTVPKTMATAASNTTKRRSYLVVLLVGLAVIGCVMGIQGTVQPSRRIVQTQLFGHPPLYDWPMAMRGRSGSNYSCFGLWLTQNNQPFSIDPSQVQTLIVKYSSNLSVDFLVVTPSQFATIQNAPPQTGNDCSALAGTPAVFTKWNSTSYDGVVEIPPDSGGSYYFYFLNSNESPVSITISVATVQVITQYGWGFYLGILLAIVSGSLAATLKLRRAGKRDNEKLGSTVESRESTEGIASTATTLTQEYETATSKRPPASQPILSTGYVDLDKALEGGIPEKFSVVIVSPSFDERDLLLRKIVETSLASGRLVVLVSNDLRRTEDLTARYPTGFYAFSPQADKILARSPNLVKIPGIDNLSDASITLNLAIRELLTKEKVSKRVMIIDILSDLLLHHKSLVARRWLTEFVGKRKAEDFTIIATLNPLSIPKEETESVIDSFDGVIEIFEKPVLERARRFLIIKKMYGQRYSEDEMLVDKDKLF